MAKTITAEMATNLTLDINSAKSSLNELTSSVKQSTSEWRIQEQQMKSAGDAVGASEAKFKGLSDVVDQQKAKVTALKQALETNNTETAKGQKQQEYLTAELAKAERQLGSYQGQLDKATQAYNYQSSGLAKLNDEIKQSNELTNARVARLEAEGNVEEANKVKQQGLTDTVDKYNDVLKIQQSELARLAESAGKSSDEYRRQQIRIEQTGAQIAHATNEMKSFGNSTDNVNSTRIRELGSAMRELHQQTAGARNLMLKMVGAQLIANGISNAWMFLTSHITGAIKAGVAYNEQMENVEVGLKNFTNNNSKLMESLADNISHLREASGYSVGTVTLLTKKAFGLTKSVDGTEKLTDAFVNLGRATGMGDDKLTGLITKFSQANASGKITSGSLTRLNKQLPGFTAALAKNLGVSGAALDKLAKKGKISMNDLAKAIESMSNTKPDGLNNYLTTFDGFTKHFEQRYQELSGMITKGFFNNKNSFLASFSKSLDGKDVNEAFNRLGSSINKSLNTITSAFGKAFGKGSSSNLLVDFVNGAATAINQFAIYIAKNSKQITEFAKGMLSIGKVAGGVAIAIGKSLLPVLTALTKALASNPKLIIGMATAFAGFGIAAKTVASLTATLGPIFKGIFAIVSKIIPVIKVAFTLLRANPIGLIITAITAVIVALVELYKHNAKFRAFVNGVFASIKKFVGDAINWFGKFFKAIGDGFVGMYKAVAKTVKTFVNDISNFFKNMFKTLTDTFKVFSDLFTGNWGSLGKDVKKVVNDLITIVKSYFKLGYDYLNTITGGWLGKMTGSFSDLSGKVGKTMSGMWAALKSAFNAGFNNLKQLMQIFQDVFTGNWGSLGRDVGKLVSSLWSGVKNTFGGAFTWLDKLTGGWLSRTNKGFADFGSGVTKIFSQMWAGIKKFATSGINDVIGIINGGISGIDGVISDFGGPKRAIGLIPKFANGTGGAPKGLAMVNDQKGVSDPREAIIDNSGDVHILSGKNRVVNFSGGETVIPAHATRELLPHFADGSKGWLGDAVNWIGDKVSGAVDWVKGAASTISDFAAHPIKTIEAMLTKFINGALGGASSLVGSLAPAFGKALIDGITGPIKKLVDNFGGSNPPGSGVERWRPDVLRALSTLGLSSSLVDKVLRQINTESGGNPTIKQGVVDINSINGDPAQGLMQVIPPTFNAYKLPGHDNILNGYDNILAGLNYAKHRYGSDLSALGNGHGYANGGLITQHQIAEIGEGNLPEMIIPLDKFKSSRAIQLLNGAVNAVAKNNGVQLNQTTNSHDDLSDKFDMMIGLLAQLVGQGQKPVTAVMDKNNFYNTQAKDGSLRAYQSFS